MKENWRTQTIPDYVANYNIADFKNNGQKQLVVGVVQFRGMSFVADARSVLYSYDLGTVETQLQMRSLWRCSSGGQSMRLISAVSGVQVPAPPPFFNPLTRKRGFSLPLPRHS